jgi:hypothetical protein
MQGVDDPPAHRRYLETIEDLLKRTDRVSNLCRDVMTRPQFHIQRNTIGNLAEELIIELKCLIVDARFCARIMWEKECDLNLNGGRVLIVEYGKQISGLNVPQHDRDSSTNSTHKPAQDDLADDDPDDVSQHMPLSYPVMSAICEASYAACFASALTLITEQNNIGPDETVAQFHDKIVRAAVSAVDAAIDVDALGFQWQTFLDDGLVQERSFVRTDKGRLALPLRSMSQINQVIQYLRMVWKFLHSEAVHVEALEEILLIAIGRLMYNPDRSCIDLDLYRIASLPQTPSTVHGADAISEVAPMDTGSGVCAESDAMNARESSSITPQVSLPQISPALFADYWLILYSLHIQRHSVLQELAEVSIRGDVYTTSANGEKTPLPGVRLSESAPAKQPRVSIFDTDELEFVAENQLPTLPPETRVTSNTEDAAKEIFDLLVFALRVCNPESIQPAAEHDVADWADLSGRAPRANIVNVGDYNEPYRGVSVTLARARIPSTQKILQWAKQYNEEVEQTSSEIKRGMINRCDSLHILPADSKLAACWEPNGDSRPLGILHWRMGQPLVDKLAERMQGGPAAILTSKDPDTNPLVACILMMLISHAHKNASPGSNPVPIQDVCLIWMDKTEEMEGEVSNLEVPVIVQLHGLWCVALAGHRTPCMIFTEALRVWLAACYYLEQKRIAMFPIQGLLRCINKTVVNFR